MNKRENFWILIIWFLVFMLILTWDQEKIVVLNLVLFCYFIRYLVGETIDNTLSQRRSVLLDSLSLDLTTQVAFLKRLVLDSKTILVTYKTIVLTLIKKALTSTNTALTGNFSAGTSPRLDDFRATQLIFQALDAQVFTKQLEQNLYISSQIVTEVSPPVFSDLESRED